MTPRESVELQYEWAQVQRGSRIEHQCQLTGGYGNRVRASVWLEDGIVTWVMHSFSAQREIARGSAKKIKDAKRYVEALATAMDAEDRGQR